MSLLVAAIAVDSGWLEGTGSEDAAIVIEFFRLGGWATHSDETGATLAHVSRGDDSVGWAPNFLAEHVLGFVGIHAGDDITAKVGTRGQVGLHWYRLTGWDDDLGKLPETIHCV